MRLILQQLRRDLAACRLPLAAYAALVVLHTLLAAWFLHASANTPSMGGGLGGWLEFSDGLFFVAGLLALWVVLLDPPAGPDAFWQGRPLRWFHLLSAKLLFVAVCLVVPLLVVPAILLSTAGAPGLWTTTVCDFAQTRLPAILVLTAAATLARDLKQSLLVLGGFVMFFLAGSFAWLLLQDVAPGLTRLAHLESAWERLLEQGTIIPALLIVIVLHFARRRLGLSVLAGMAVIALTVSVDLSPLASRWRHQDLAVAGAGLLPEFDASIRDNSTVLTSDEQTGLRTRVSAELDITGPEAPYAVIPQYFTLSEVRYPDGDRRNTMATLPSWQQSYNPSENPLYQATFQAAVPGCTLMNPNPYSRPTQVWLRLANYDLMHVTLIDREWLSGRETVRPSYHPRDDRGRIGTFEGSLQFTVQRLDAFAQLPLQPGSTWSDDGEKLLVLGIDSFPGQGTALTIRKQFVWIHNRPARLFDLSFLLVRPDRKEAYLPSHVGRTTWLRIHPFSQADDQVFYHTGPDGDVTIPQDWLAGAQVLAVHRQDIGSAVKELHVDGFRLWPDEE